MSDQELGVDKECEPVVDPCGMPVDNGKEINAAGIKVGKVTC